MTQHWRPVAVWIVAALLGQDAVDATRPPSDDTVFRGRGPFVAVDDDAPAILVESIEVGSEANDVIPVIVALVGAKPGMNLADIGAGTGRHTEPLARQVGVEGIVYSLDVREEVVEAIRKRAQHNNLPQIRARLSTAEDVGLPRASVDVALLSDVYHIVLQSQSDTKDTFLRSIHDSLKPGGVVVVTYFFASPNSDPEERDGLHLATLRDFQRHGFERGRRWSFEKVPGGLYGGLRPVAFEFRRRIPTDD